MFSSAIRIRRAAGARPITVHSFTIGASARHRIARSLLLRLTLPARALLVLTLVRVRLVRTSLFIAHVASFSSRQFMIGGQYQEAAKGIPRSCDPAGEHMKPGRPNVSRLVGKLEPQLRTFAAESERAVRASRANGAGLLRPRE